MHESQLQAVAYGRCSAPRRVLWIGALVTAAMTCTAAQAQDAAASSSAQALAATYASSVEKLRNSPFKRPLHLESTEGSGTLKGEVLALVDHPFAQVRQALAAPANWCSVLALHPNTARCEVLPGAEPRLAVNLARKFDQPLKDTYRADFVFRTQNSTPDYLDIHLNADKGPVGTRNYRFQVQAMPVEGKTFLRLVYAYSYGLSARLATQTYLSTKGSSKVGFTTIGTGKDGKPKLIGGLRGAVERNAVRYYLAIDAYLDELGSPSEQRFPKSLQRWLDSIEQYPLQLQEDDRNAYTATKLERHGGPP